MMTGGTGSDVAGEPVTAVDFEVWPDPVEFTSSSRVARPQGTGAGLPVLYLLHGIADTPADWWLDKGQLAGILAAARAHPMLLVMVPNGTPGGVRAEPPFAEFKARFDAVVEAVNAEYQPDRRRQGLAGISMGAKQALAILLADHPNAFSVLGLFSGMFHGNHLITVHGALASWPANRGASLALYFHYCGRGNDIPRDPPARPIRGDATFYENNVQVCRQLGGTRMRTRADGMHNWQYWRPELGEFFRALSQVW